MKFWEEHAKLRVLLIAILFATGVTAAIWGWTLTGKLEGLGIMIAGVALLLVALWIYNKPFERTPKKQS